MRLPRRAVSLNAVSSLKSPRKTPPGKRVTVRDIAKATGLHYTTVSLGLRNSHLLRARTRAKIQKAAARLGYTPDPMLAALNAYRRATRTPHFQAVIAWINNWPRRRELLDVSTFREYYEGVCSRAHELGYLVDEFWLREPGMTPEKLRRVLRTRNIQAVLMAPQPGSHITPNFNFEGLAAVSFGYSMQPAVLNVITNHHFHSMSTMLSHLIALGYRRIGLYLSQDWDEKVNNAWLGSLLVAQRRHPKVVFIPEFEESPTDLRAWLRERRPDVVISHDGLAREIAALGYSIPRDLGFASLDLSPGERRLSGICQNSFRIGQKAVDLLVEMTHRGEFGIPEIPTRTLVEGVWVPGRTLRKQPAPRKQRPML